MLCDICSKSHATVHLTEVINGEVTELHLCEECAREKGSQMEQHFGLTDLLAGLSDLGKGLTPGIGKEPKCSNCGLSYRDFRKIGRLGCSECYKAFKDSLVPLLKRIHGSVQHLGKTPVKTKGTAKIETKLHGLRDKLRQAIQLEEFEKAAELRDEIRELESKEEERSEN